MLRVQEERAVQRERPHSTFDRQLARLQITAERREREKLERAISANHKQVARRRDCSNGRARRRSNAVDYVHRIRDGGIDADHLVREPLIGELRLCVVVEGRPVAVGQRVQRRQIHRIADVDILQHRGARFVLRHRQQEIAVEFQARDRLELQISTRRHRGERVGQRPRQHGRASAHRHADVDRAEVAGGHDKAQGVDVLDPHVLRLHAVDKDLRQPRQETGARERDANAAARTTRVARDFIHLNG